MHTLDLWVFPPFYTVALPGMKSVKSVFYRKKTSRCVGERGMGGENGPVTKPEQPVLSVRQPVQKKELDI